jgi:hypothetical protein
VLGFTTGDPWPAAAPVFVLVQRDDVVLQFHQVEAGEAAGTTSISIDVSDALAVHAAFARAR